MTMESRDWRAALRDDLRQVESLIWAKHNERSVGNRGLHLAIFVEPYLQLILDGVKTVESRFSAVKCAPFGVVSKGDVLLLKRSGGPIVGVSEVKGCLYFDSRSRPKPDMARQFAASVCIAEHVLWKKLRDANYATLLQIGKAVTIDPMLCRKKDRRGWVVLTGRA